MSTAQEAMKYLSLFICWEKLDFVYQIFALCSLLHTYLHRVIKLSIISTFIQMTIPSSFY